MARTEILNTNGEPETLSYMEMGYSQLAILISLLFGSMLVLGMVVNGGRKLQGGYWWRIIAWRLRRRVSGRRAIIMPI